MNILTFLTPKDQTFYLSKKSTIRQALEKYDYHKFTVVPLIDSDGRYYATVSEGDILRYIKNHSKFDLQMAENTTLDEIEHYRSYQVLSINCSLKEVIELSLEQNFIPLIDDRGMYIGIIKRKDIIEYLYVRFMKEHVKFKTI